MSIKTFYVHILMTW